MDIACDSHVHIVGDQAAYPWAPGRSYTAPPATVAMLRAVAEGAGIGRFVVVQPSFYGTDNRPTLDALDALGGSGRGVAVIDPAITDDAALRAMHAQGVRGLRINLYSRMAAAMPALDQAFLPTRDVAARMGWHVQVIAPAPVLLAAAGLLDGAGVPVVLDHYALPGGIAPGSPDGRALLALARRPHVWVKLSAPYRVHADPLATDPPADWLAALLDAAPDRTVWGSDWPHTPDHLPQPGQPPPHLPWRAIGYRALVDRFRAALPGGAWQAVMCRNPALLYGFEG